MPAAPHAILDVFLAPGQFHFAGADTRIRTLLGSCVAITLWHPRLRIGGMCHFLLPTRSGFAQPLAEPDGRFADEAILLLQREIHAHHTRALEYQAKLFGAGAMFGNAPGECAAGARSVPARNAAAARALLAEHGFVVAAEDLGGHGHRKLIFELWSGDVWCCHHALPVDSLPLEGSCP